MQLPNPPSPHWADKVSAFFPWIFGTGGLLTAIVAVYKLILYKNKPRSDIAKIDAETENLRIDGAVKASDQLLRMFAKVGRLEAQMDRQDREFHDALRARDDEARTTREFYRKQLERWEELDLAYRKRFHAVNNEMGRLNLALCNLEAEYKEKTGNPPEHPYKFRDFDSLVAEFPLPPAAE